MYLINEKLNSGKPRLVGGELHKSRPVSGDELKKTQEVFEDYLKTLVEHDPGVGIWKVLFGNKGGVERSMDMHFGR